MISFNYSTEKIERDFHFVESGEVCRLRGVPSRVGNESCMACPFNKGSVYPWELSSGAYRFFENNYVLCNHKDSKDSENSGGVQYAYYKKFKNEALNALCY